MIYKWGALVQQTTLLGRTLIQNESVFFDFWIQDLILFDVQRSVW